MGLIVTVLYVKLVDADKFLADMVLFFVQKVLINVVVITKGDLTPLMNDHMDLDDENDASKILQRVVGNPPPNIKINRCEDCYEDQDLIAEVGTNNSSIRNRNDELNSPCGNDIE